MIVANFKEKLKVPLCGGLQKESWNAFIVPLEIRCNSHNGFGFAVFWYPRMSEEFVVQVKPPTIKRIFSCIDRPSSDKPLVLVGDKNAQSVLVAGGKGSSIAILRSIQDTKKEVFPDKRNTSQQVSPIESITSLFSDSKELNVLDYHVPQGFIVSVAAFERHLRDNPKIAEALHGVEEVAYERVPGELRNFCEMYGLLSFIVIKISI